eukprot:scaffold1289_cov274-Pinguiococcus_pyrenoidosus.AAC.13
MNSAFSSSVRGSGTSVKFASQRGRSASVMSPSMYRTRAFTRSERFTPSLNGRPRTLGCCLRCQIRTFLPASFTQSTRDCCPAPTPTICPHMAYPTEFDWVYFSVMLASTRSLMASGGIW